MALKLGDKFTAANLFMIVIIAIIGIYLWGQFTEKTAEGYEFVSPEEGQLETISLWVIRLLIIGTAVFLGYGTVMKMSGKSLSRKDIFTLVIIGVAVYFIWTYLLESIWSAASFSDIEFKTAAKLGLLK